MQIYEPVVMVVWRLTLAAPSVGGREGLMNLDLDA